MNPKFIVVLGLLLLAGSAFARNCNRGNISACTAANTQCMALSGQHDYTTNRCDCLQGYGQCLMNVGCDPSSTDTDNDDSPGNAVGEFRSIVSSCNAYGCGAGGICSIFVPPVGAPSSATSLITKEVASVVVAAATLVIAAV